MATRAQVNLWNCIQSGTGSGDCQSWAGFSYVVLVFQARVPAHGSMLSLFRRVSPPQILSRHNLPDIYAWRCVSWMSQLWVNAVFVWGRSLLLSYSLGTTSQACLEVCLLGDFISSSVDWLSHYPFKIIYSWLAHPTPSFPQSWKGGYLSSSYLVLLWISCFARLLSACNTFCVYSSGFCLLSVDFSRKVQMESLGFITKWRFKDQELKRKIRF